MTAAPRSIWFGLLFLSLAYLMPGHYLPWASFQNQWVAAFGAALIASATVLHAWRGSVPVAIPPLALGAAALASVPMLQWASGQVLFFSDALLSSSYLLAFAICVAAGAVWAAQARSSWLDGLFAAIAIAATFSVGLALTQWLSMEVSQVWVARAPPGARPFANLGQPNHFALLLILGLIGTWRAHVRGALRGSVAMLLTLWLGLGLVMTQSRAGWLVVALLMLWALLKRQCLPGITPTRVGVVAALFVMGVLGWDGLNHALGLTQTSDLVERLQAGPRSLIWLASLDAIGQSPWFGYGANQVVLGHQAAATSAPAVHRMIESAHNLILDTALWVGVPLALVLVLAVGRWLIARGRACAGVDDWAVLAAVGSIGLHSMVEFPYEHAYFLLPLGFLMGTFPASPPAARPRQGAIALAMAIFAMTVLLLAVGAEYLKVEQANRQARLAMVGVGSPASAESAPPEVLLLDAPREYHRLMLTPARESMSESELDWMRRVTRRHAFPPAMLRYALAAGLNGRPDEAQQTLARLCSMHPPPRCDEARAAWRTAQARWPVLEAVPAP